MNGVFFKKSFILLTAVVLFVSGFFMFAGTASAALTWSADAGAMDWSAGTAYCGGLSTDQSIVWRLPSPNELVAAYTSGVPGSFADVYYWSGTTNPVSSATAYDVLMSSGYVDGSDKAAPDYHVRCVRSTADVVWQSGAGTTMDWNAGTAYCGALSTDQAIVWRLPSKNELSAAYTSGVPGSFAGDFYWSGTTTPGTNPVGVGAYKVRMSDGVVTWGEKTYPSTYIRCVRDKTLPDLGAAGSFAILAGSAIVGTGTDAVTGDVGLSSMTGAAITLLTCSEMTGVSKIYDVDGAYSGGGDPDVTCLNTPFNSTAAGSKTALALAYTDASTRATTSPIDPELNNQTLTAGVYDSSDGTFTNSGTLMLDGAGNPDSLFIFKMASSLTTTSDGLSHVKLKNGAKASNVFWVVGTSATLGDYSDLMGTIMAKTSITLGTGATVHGRLLADADNNNDGAVTLTGSNTVILDTTAPTGAVSFATSPITLGNLTGTVTVNYTEPMDSTGNNEPTITFKGAGALTPTLKGEGGSWTNNDQTWTGMFDFSGVSDSETGVVVTSSGAQDLSGNPEGTNTSTGTFDIDTAATTYTVTYSDNGKTGGSVPIDSGTYINGATVTVSSNSGSLVKDGYSFAGWNTLANGSGTDHAAASTFAMGLANVTLYAKWVATYAVTDGTITTAEGDTTSTVNIVTSPAEEGAIVTLTVVPETGMQLKTGTLAATYNDGSPKTLTLSGSAPYTFTMPAYAVTVTATFEAITCSSVSNAATYNAYPTCGPATCNSGYVLSGGACIVQSSGGVGGGNFLLFQLQQQQSNQAIMDQLIARINVLQNQINLILGTKITGAGGSKAFNFTRDLYFGTTGEDVRQLQIYLNYNGFELTNYGAGSKGNETTMFGTLTKQALINFQKANNISPAIGFFGPITRAFISKQ